jgi:hypothetical protein
MPNAAFLKPLGVTLYIVTFLAAMSGLVWPSGPVRWFGMELLYLIFAANVLMVTGIATSNHPKLSVGQKQVPLALGGVALLVIFFAWLTQLAHRSPPPARKLPIAFPLNAPRIS